MWVRSRLSCPLYKVICATSHNMDRCLWGGHIWNWGLVVHSSGMYRGSICRRDAILFFAHSHELAASPHAVILWVIVSVLSDLVHLLFGVRLILFEPTISAREQRHTLSFRPRGR
jgi:hypothetical protein